MTIKYLDEDIKANESFEIDKATSVCKNILQKADEKTITELLDYLTNNKHRAKLIWEYPGMLLLIIQVLTEPFSHLKLTSLSKEQLNKVILMLKCITILAEDDDVKFEILESKTHHLIFPYISKVELHNNPYGDEKIKTTAIDVFLVIYKSGLISVKDEKVFDIFPLILRVLEFENQRIKVKSTSLLVSLLQSELGFNYAIQTPERFEAIHSTLFPLISNSIEGKNVLLLKNVLKIYLRLCDMIKVKEKLKDDGICNELHSKDVYSLTKYDCELQNLQRDLIKSISQSL